MVFGEMRPRAQAHATTQARWSVRLSGSLPPMSRQSTSASQGTPRVVSSSDALHVGASRPGRKTRRV